MLLLLPGALPVAAQPADSPATEPPPAGGRPAPALHLSLSEVPGETTVRMPVAGEGYRLYGLLSPYLSLGSTTTLSLPGNASRAPGLQADTDRLDDVRLGAGMALPLSGRTQLYGEYRFLRGRIDGGAGRGLLQREPDSADFRAGFSIRLD
jgi:opacity protein-like surface antigen